MRELSFLWFLIVMGCGIFNPDKYNPNPRPVVIEAAEEPEDKIKVDTIRLTNGVDHIIILDTLKAE
tara:strand:+ start:246 stop:443 length:198 start_codon:yes stop_codon:yes gene_type:complete